MTLTFVLAPYFALGLPLISPAPAPDTEEPAQEVQTSAPSLENLDIAQPKNRSEISARGLIDESDYHNFGFVGLGAMLTESSSASLAFRLIERSDIRHEWGYGLDIQMDQSLFLHGSHAYLFRPYSKIKYFPMIELGLRAQPSEALATLVKTDNFFLRVGGGLSYHWMTKHSFRMETKYAQGMSEGLISFHLGYVWAWR